MGLLIRPDQGGEGSGLLISANFFLATDTITRFQKNVKSLTPHVKRCLWLLNRVYILEILISHYVQKDRYLNTRNLRPDLLNRLEIRIRPCDVKKPAGGYILVEGIETTARIQSWDKVGFCTILN